MRRTNAHNKICENVFGSLRLHLSSFVRRKPVLTGRPVQTGRTPLAIPKSNLQTPETNAFLKRTPAPLRSAPPENRTIQKKPRILTAARKKSLSPVFQKSPTSDRQKTRLSKGTPSSLDRVKKIPLGYPQVFRKQKNGRTFALPFFLKNLIRPDYSAFFDFFSAFFSALASSFLTSSSAAFSAASAAAFSAATRARSLAPLALTSRSTSSMIAIGAASP